MRRLTTWVADAGFDLPAEGKDSLAVYVCICLPFLPSDRNN